MFIYFRYHINKIFLILFIILISCQKQDPLKNHGILFLENRSNKLALNQSNKNDVIKVLGSPQIVEDENKLTWIYIERILTKGKYHKLGRHVLKENNILVLKFDKYGILTDKILYDKEISRRALVKAKSKKGEMVCKDLV